MENKKLADMTIQEFFLEFKRISEKENTTNPDDFITKKIACEKLKISLPTLDALIKNGKIKKYDIGGRRKLLRYSEIKNLILQ